METDVRPLYLVVTVMSCLVPIMSHSVFFSINFNFFPFVRSLISFIKLFNAVNVSSTLFIIKLIVYHPQAFYTLLHDVS